MGLFSKKEHDPEDLKEVVRQFKALKKDFLTLKKELVELKDGERMDICKVEMVRYNPFSSTGSDQSFSVCLLDSNNNGIVVTSLYSTDGNRVYGKKIVAGNSEYSLSKEEEKIIKKAIDGK